MAAAHPGGKIFEELLRPLFTAHFLTPLGSVDNLKACLLQGQKDNAGQSQHDPEISSGLNFFFKISQ